VSDGAGVHVTCFGTETQITTECYHIGRAFIRKTLDLVNQTYFSPLPDATYSIGESSIMSCVDRIKRGDTVLAESRSLWAVQIQCNVIRTRLRSEGIMVKHGRFRELASVDAALK